MRHAPAREACVPPREPQRILGGTFLPDTKPHPDPDAEERDHIACAERRGGALALVPGLAFRRAIPRSSTESQAPWRWSPLKCRAGGAATRRSVLPQRGVALGAPLEARGG